MSQRLVDRVLHYPKRLAKFVRDRVRAVPQGRRFASARVIAAPPMAGERLRFIAVGRQGYGTTTCRQIADAMERTATESPTHGVFILGDNFFPLGVRSTRDLQWRLKFEFLYNGPHLRGLPFYAVLGNHDHVGRAQAQIDYTNAHGKAPHATGRWRMEAPYYTHDFGHAHGRPLLRVVFLDTVPLLDAPDVQLAFARQSFDAPGDPVWRVIVGHAGGRTLSKMHTAGRTLTPWLSDFIEMKVDAFLSADDWFQQLLDHENEPMTLSTNGGTYKNEKDVPIADPSREFAASQPGFGAITVDATTLTLELRGPHGNVVCTRQRRKTATA